MSERRWELPLLFAVIVAIKFSALDNPFYWDEAGAYALPSVKVADRGLWRALPGCHDQGELLGHPPVLYLIHGAIYQLFGRSVVPHHLAALVFAAIGTWYTYRTGRLLGSLSTGICAALLLFFAPMYFAQAPMVLGDLPIAALGIASAYYLLQGRALAYAVTATLMLQTKETALAVSVAAALYWFFIREKDRPLRQSILMHAIPIGSLAAFYALEYAGTGAFAQAGVFQTHSLLVFDFSDPAGAISQIADQSKRAGAMLFVKEGRFMLTAIVALAAITSMRAMKKGPLALCALVAALYWAAFSTMALLPRYFMPVLPFFCIAAAWSVFAVVRGRSVAQYFVVSVIVIVFVSCFYTSRSASGNYETNRQHERVIAATATALRYVESNFRHATVVAGWPESLYLNVPEMGYVRSPVSSRNARDVLRITGPLAIVYSNLQPSTEMRLIRERAAEEGLRRLLQAAENEVVVEVWAR